MALNPLTITPTGGKAAAVTFTDFVACAAIEHVLDTVLLPKSVSFSAPLSPLIFALIEPLTPDYIICCL